MKKTSQVAIELMILIIVLLSFFIVFMSIMQSNMNKQNSQTDYSKLMQVGINIQSEINNAFESYDGFYREFTLPQKVNDKDYTIARDGNSIYLEYIDKKSSVLLNVMNYTGNIQRGKNTIKKINGEVRIN